MFYDKAAGATERHFPQYRPLVDEARLFRIEPTNRVANESTDALGQWEPDEQLIDNFRLPFEAIAVEDANTRHDSTSGACVFFHALTPTNRHYEFLTIFEAGKDEHFAHGQLIAFPDADIENPQGKLAEIRKMQLWKYTKKSITTLHVDAKSIVLRRTGSTDPELDKILYAPKAVLSREEHEDIILRATALHEKLIAHLLHSIVQKALLAVVIINTPNTFIVEERPINEPKDKKDRIVRSQHRPHYIVLEPKDIRRRLGLPELEYGPKTPHERRGHYRRLTSERYSDEVRGTTIWVKACWVGPKEAIKEHNRYTVLLDK